MTIKNIVIGSVLATLISSGYASTHTSAHTATTPHAATSVAVVDVHAILDKLPQMETMRSDLEHKFSTRHDSLTKEQESIKTRAEKLDKDRTVMKQAEFEKASKTLLTEQQNLETRQQQFQKEVYTAQDNAMKDIMQTITNTVTEVATSHHYDVVVPKNSTMYVSNGYEITQEVISLLAK